MKTMIFSALFEHSSLGIIISNEQGVIEQTNPWATKMFGYAPGELVGQQIEVLIPPHLRVPHIKYRENYNKNPLPRSMGSNLNLMACKKDASLFPVEVSLTYFEADGLRHIVSFINDITERKKAENDLRKLTEELELNVRERTKELSDALLELSHTNEGLKQEMEQRKKVEAQILSMLQNEKDLNELKSRFVSMASHEFRTPLGGIMTSATLIAKYPNSEDQGKREKHIQNIKKSVRNLTNILNDFLSLDKLDQGKVASCPVKFNLTSFIDEIIDEHSETSDKVNIFRVNHADPGVLVTQEKEMLRNVLINLISNAIKYSPEESPVLISTRLSSDHFIIEIKDQGLGIPLEDQKHLFERFFRAKNVINLQGTGLGLNIVKRYIDIMGGSIDFQSEERVGTTFIVSLPMEKK